MFRHIFLKFLTALCGDVKLVKEKLAFSNRKTRRASARELVRLGYEDKGFKIEGKMVPLKKGDNGIKASFKTAGEKISEAFGNAKQKLGGMMPGGPKKDDEDKEKSEAPSDLEKTWTGMEQLEERILLSATLGAEADSAKDLLDMTNSADLHQQLNDSQALADSNSLDSTIFDDVETLDFNSQVQSSDDFKVEGEAAVMVSGDEEIFASVDRSEVVLAGDNTAGQVTSSLNVVIVDAALVDSQDLIDDLPSNAQIFFLNADEDGLTQITDILSQFEGIDSLSILSHGSEAQLNLGSSVLSANNLDANSETLSSWQQYLSADADLLLYGCDVAGNDLGEQFVTDLASLTGADVAASDDLTGASNLGGDWDLEFSTGAIEASFISSDYDGTLVNVITVTAEDANKTVAGTANADQFEGEMTNVRLAGGQGDDIYNVYGEDGSKSVKIYESTSIENSKDTVDFAGYKNDIEFNLDEQGAFVADILEGSTLFPENAIITTVESGVEIIKGGYGDDKYKWDGLLVNNGGSQKAFTIIEDDSAGSDTLDLSGATIDGTDGLLFTWDSKSKLTVTTLDKSVTYIKDAEGIENVIGTGGNDVFLFLNKGVLKGYLNGGAGEDIVSYTDNTWVNYTPGIVSLFGTSYGGKVEYDATDESISKIAEGKSHQVTNIEVFSGGSSGDIIKLKDNSSYTSGGTQPAIDPNKLTDDTDNQWEQIAYGHTGGDFFQGANTNDVFYGGSHNDTIYGMEGNDKLVGGSGADVLIGGKGGDYLIGNDINGGSISATSTDDDQYRFLDDFGNDTIIDDVGDNILDFSDFTKSLNFYFKDIAGIGNVHKQVKVEQADDPTTKDVNEQTAQTNTVFYESKNDTGEGDVSEVWIARDKILSANQEYYFQFQDSWDELVINNMSETGFVWLDFSLMSADFTFDFYADGSVDITNTHGDTLTVNHVSRIDVGTGTNTFRMASGTSYDAELVFTHGSTNILDLSSFSDATKDVEVDLGAIGGVGSKGTFTGSIVYRDSGTSVGDASEVVLIDKFGGPVGAGGSIGVQGFSSYIGANVNFKVTGDDNALIVDSGLGDDEIISSSTSTEADTINAESGDDIVQGGEGADTITGGTGDDTLYGEFDTDVSSTVDDADDISGGAGDDSIYGGDGGDTLKGDTGDDTIYGGDDNDTISGGDGADILKGGAGDDTITGGAGNDQLYGGDDSNTSSAGDSLAGGTGHDTYYLDDAAWDSITVTENAGEGSDTLDFSAVDNTGKTFTYTFANSGSGQEITAAQDTKTTTIANIEKILASANGTNNFVFETTASGVFTIDGNGATSSIELKGNIADFTVTESSDGTLIIVNATTGLYIIAINMDSITYQETDNQGDTAAVTKASNKWNGDGNITNSNSTTDALLKSDFENNANLVIADVQEAIVQVIEQFALYTLENYKLPLSSLSFNDLFDSDGDGTEDLFSALDTAITNLKAGSYADLDALITAVNSELPNFGGSDWLTVTYEGGRADFTFAFEKVFTTTQKFALDLTSSTGAAVPDGSGTSKLLFEEVGASTDGLATYDLADLTFNALAKFNVAFDLNVMSSDPEFTFDEGSSADVEISMSEAGLEFHAKLKGDWTSAMAVKVKHGQFLLDTHLSRKLFADSDTDYKILSSELNSGNAAFNVTAQSFAATGELVMNLPILYGGNETNFRYGSDAGLIVTASVDSLGVQYNNVVSPDFGFSGALVDFLRAYGAEAVAGIFIDLGNSIDGSVNIDIPLIGSLSKIIVEDGIGAAFTAVGNLLKNDWTDEVNKSVADQIQQYETSKAEGGTSWSETGSTFGIIRTVLNVGIDLLADRIPFFISAAKVEDFLDPTHKDYDPTYDPNEYSRFGFDISENGLELELKLVGKLSDEVPIDVSATLPGFDFQIDEGSNINLDVGFNTDLKIGYYNQLNTSYFFLDVSNDDEIELNVSATLDDGTNMTAILGGLLEVSLTEQAASVDGRNSGFFGHIGIDLKGGDGQTVNLKRESDSLEFAANLHIFADFDLEANIGAGSAAAPEVSTVIHYEQNFVNLTYSTASGFDFTLGESPVLEFENVELDLGTFLTKTLKPFVNTFNEIMGPIRPFITGDPNDETDGFLEQEVAFLNGLGVIDANAVVADNKVQMVEVLYTLAALYDAQQQAQGKSSSMAGAIKGIFTFFKSVDSLTKAMEEGGSGKINFGNFRIGGKSGTTNLTDKDAAKNAAEDPDKQADLAKKNKAATSDGADTSATTDSKKAFEDQSKLAEKTATFNAGFELPILEDPVTMFKLLTGQPADLIVLNFDALFAIEQYIGATFFGVLNAGITFRAEMGLDLDIGVDSRGEVFVRDYEDGTNPPVYVELSTLASVSLGIKGIVEAGIEGGLTGRVNFDFDDQLRYISGTQTIDPEKDRIYLSDIHDPACLFNINGKITAGLDLFAKVNLPTPFGKITIFSERWNLFTATLYQFEFKCTPKQVASFNSTTGELVLDTSGETGLEYTLTEFVNPVDGLTYVQVSNQHGNKIGGDPLLKSKLKKISFAGTSGNDSVFVDDTIQGVDIDFTGGEGDDVFSIEGSHGTVSIDGGAGNDMIFGADTGGTLTGGAGDDAIQGGAGIDIITGGAGDDTIIAGAGNDDIDAGDGADTIWGDDGLDTILGGAGADTIYGGDGVDTITAGDGNDVITGGAHADTINTGLGDDLILWSYGDGGDDVNSDELTADTDSIIITGDEDNGQTYTFGRDLDDPTEIAFDTDGQTMTLDGVEIIDFRAGTGADTINIYDLSNTGFENFVVNTGQTYNKDADGNHLDGYVDRAADASADQINIFGTAANETFLVGNEYFDVDGDLNTVDDQKNTILVDVRQRNSAESYGINIVDSTDALDVLTVDAQGGDDIVDASTYVTELALLKLRGGEGSDLVIGSQYDDEIYGDQDNDIDISYRNKLLAGVPNITATAGLFGGGGNDIIDGGTGNDFIMGEDGADQLIGGAGDDWMAGGAGTDQYYEMSLTGDSNNGGDIDTIFDVQDAHYFLTANRLVAVDGTFASSAERENWDGSTVTGETTRQDEDLKNFFENVYLVGGDSANTFKLDGWAANAFLDGAAGGDSYIVELASAGSGVNLVQIQDSGTTGLDDLVYRGSASDDTIQLDRIYKRDEDDGSWNGSYAADGKRYSEDRWNGSVNIAGEDYSFGDHKDGVLVAHFGSSLTGYQSRTLTDIENSDTNKVGTSSISSINNYQILNFNTIENVVVRGDEGADSFILDDSPVGINVYGDGGNDSFFVGSVLNTDQTVVEGQNVDVVTEYTNGVSNVSKLYGGDGADYFEVNHNAAETFMYGQNGDDLFYVKALLEYKDPLTKEAAALANAQSTVNSGFDTNADDYDASQDQTELDADALVYIQNANINIDGGTGFDTLVLVGTALGDDFYIFNDNGSQKIYGAGVKLDNLTNVENVAILTGGGDDNVYIYGLDLDGSGALRLVTGSGSDNVYFGGDQITTTITIPESYVTNYQYLHNLFKKGSIHTVSSGDDFFGFDFDFIDFDSSTELLPMTVRVPSYTENLVIPESKDLLSAIISPILIDGGVNTGGRDNIVFNDQLGRTFAALSQRNVTTRSFTEDNSKIGVFSLLPGGATSAKTDLLQLDGATNDIVTAFIKQRSIYLDRFVDDTLLTNLETTNGSIDIPQGTIYRTFETTTSNNVTTSGWEALQAFAASNNLVIDATQNNHPDTSRSDVFIEINSIKRNNVELAFEVIYDEITVTDNNVDTVFRNMNSLSLVAADDLSVALSAGYVTPSTLVNVSVENFNTMNFGDSQAQIDGTLPNIHFNNFEEIDVNLSNSGTSFELDNTKHTGLVTVTGGTGADTLTVTNTSATTVLQGGAGNDKFVIADSTTLGGQLFIHGTVEGSASDAGDTIEINGDESSYTFDEGTFRHEESTERNFNLNDVLAISQLDPIEAAGIQAVLEGQALNFRTKIEQLTKADIENLWDQYLAEQGSELNSALTSFETAFASGFSDVRSQEGDRFENESSVFLDALLENYNEYITNATWYELANNLGESHALNEVDPATGSAYQNNLCFQYIVLSQKKGALNDRGVDASNLLKELYDTMFARDESDHAALQEDFIVKMQTVSSEYLTKRNNNWTNYTGLLQIGRDQYGYTDSDYAALGLNLNSSKFSEAVIEGGADYIAATWSHSSVRYLAPGAFDTLAAQQVLDYEADLANSNSSDSVIKGVWTSYNTVKTAVDNLQAAITNHTNGSITDSQLLGFATALQSAISTATASNNSDNLYQTRFKAMLDKLQIDIGLSDFITDLNQIIADKVTLGTGTIPAVADFAALKADFNNNASTYHDLRTVISNLDGFVNKLQDPTAVTGYDKFSDAAISATALDAFMGQLNQIGGGDDILDVFQASYGNALTTVQSYLSDLVLRDKIIELEELELELAALQANQAQLEALYGSLNDNELSAAKSLKDTFDVDNSGLKPSKIEFTIFWADKTIVLFSYTPRSYEYELAEARKADAIALYNAAEAKFNEVMKKIRTITGITPQDLPKDISDLQTLIANKKAAISQDLTTYENAQAELEALTIYARFISSEVKDTASTWTEAELDSRLNPGTERDGTITAYTNQYTAQASNTQANDFDVLTVTGQSGNQINIDSSFTGAITVNTGDAAQNITVDGGIANGNIVFNLGGGNDEVYIKNTVQGSFTVNTEADVDKVVIGNDSNTLDDIKSTVTVDLGGDAGDLLQVNDSGDATGRTGTLTASTITGLGNTGTINYSNVDQLDINLGTLADTLNITGTSANTTNIDGGKGNDIFNVSGATAALNIKGSDDNDTLNITGTGLGSVLDFQGGTGVDNVNVKGPANVLGNVDITLGAEAGESLTIDDTTSNAGSNATINATKIAGFNASGDIDYAGAETLNVNLGGGVDTLNVESTHTGVTNINTGAGADIITLAKASNVDSLAGTINVDGQADADTIIVDDSLNTTAKTAILNSTSLTGLSPATLNYTSENLDIRLGSGGDNVTINSTHAGTTDITGAAGTDRFTINNTAGTVNLDGGSEVDTFTVNDSNGAVTIKAGTANDIVDVNKATSGTLNIQGEADQDTITLGKDSTLSDIDAAVTIDGGTESDTIILDGSADAGNRTLDLTNSTIALTDMAGGVNYSNAEDLQVQLGAGQDTVNIASTHTGTTTVKSAASNDTFNLGTGNVDGIQGTLNIDGEGNTDTINVNDSANATAKTATIRNNQITGLATGTINYSNTEDLNIDFGTGADNVTVESTHAGTTDITTGAGLDQVRIKTIAGETTLDTGADADTITVGNDANRLEGIQANLTIDASTEGDIINLNDSGETTAQSGVLTDSALTGFGIKAGSAINYSNTETLNVELGSEKDTLTVNSTQAATTNVNTNAGNDDVTINDASGTFNLGTQAGTDTVTVNDSNGAVTIKAGTANDIIDVNKATSGTLDIKGEAGQDTITLGKDSTLSDIDAAVTIDGGIESDTIILDGSADAGNRTLDLTNSTIALTDMAGGVNYSNAEDLQIQLGAGQDTVNIASTHAGTTTVKSAASNDTFNLGTGNVDAIQGTLNIDGEGETDTINVNDSANASAKTASITNNQITGLASGTINYSNAEDLNVDFGTGADNVTVESTHAGATDITTGAGLDQVRVKTIAGETTLDTGADADTITVGNDANRLEGIQANLTIDASTEGDTINLNNSGETTAQSGTLTDSALTGFGIKIGSAINYSNAETLNVELGSEKDTLTVNSTHAGTTNVNANAGNDDVTINDASGTFNLGTQAGTDTVTVNDLRGNATISTGSENDTIDVNAANADSLTINGDAGEDAITINTNNSTVTTINGGSEKDTVILETNDSTTTINGDAGDDFVAIKKTNAEVTFNGGADNDDLAVYNDGGNVDDILDTVNFDGGAGTDSLTISDLTNTTGRNVTISSNQATIDSKLFTYTNHELVDIFLGSGEDTVTVNGVAAGSDTRINTGAANDTVYIGQAGQIDGLQGDLFVSAGTGSNTLFIDDSADADTGRIGDGKISGFGTGGESTYQGFRFVDVRLNDGDTNTFIEEKVAIYGEFGSADLLQPNTDKDNVYLVNVQEINDPNIDKYIIEWGDGLATVLDANGGDSSGEYFIDSSGTLLMAKREPLQFGFIGHRYQTGTVAPTLTLGYKDGSEASQGALPVKLSEETIIEDPYTTSTVRIANIPVDFTTQEVFSTFGEIRAVQAHWDFGDGNESTAFDPTHTFTQVGVYTVTATILDENGDLFTRSFEVEIFNVPIKVTPSNPSTSSPSVSPVPSLSTGGDSGTQSSGNSISGTPLDNSSDAFDNSQSLGDQGFSSPNSDEVAEGAEEPDPGLIMTEEEVNEALKAIMEETFSQKSEDTEESLNETLEEELEEIEDQLDALFDDETTDIENGETTNPEGENPEGEEGVENLENPEGTENSEDDSEDTEEEQTNNSQVRIWNLRQTFSNAIAKVASNFTKNS